MEVKEVGNAGQLRELFNKPEGKRNFRAYWSSPEKFAAHLESVDPNTAWCKDAWERGDPSFYGETFNKAIEMARVGWKEGVKQVSALRDRVLEKNPEAPKFKRYGIAGSIPNVPRAIAGNPLNMLVTDLARSRKRPVITLLSDMCAAGYVNKDTFLRRAAVVAALIDKIEGQGYACEVIGVAQTECGGFTSQVAVLVKNSNQPLDLPRLAFGLGHCAMFRRLVFAQWESDSCNSELGSGLGHVHAIDRTGLSEKSIYVIPAQGHYFDSDEKAETVGLQYLINSLREQGCPCI